MRNVRQERKKMKKAIGVTIGVLVVVALALAITPTTRDEIHWQWASHKDVTASYVRSQSPPFDFFWTDGVLSGDGDIGVTGNGLRRTREALGPTTGRRRTPVLADRTP